MRRLTPHVDPTAPTPETERIVAAAATLPTTHVTPADLVAWVVAHPRDVPVLGLTVGLSREKLINLLRHQFGTPAWAVIAREQPEALIAWLDEEFEVVASLDAQASRDYTLADVLVARAGTRATAIRAGHAGRYIEDEIEDLVRELGLPYVVRSRFIGRDGFSAPADLIIGELGSGREIVIPAKGFDSTGSKLTDAEREIAAVAAVRLPGQAVLAVIDGIGWNMRKADLRRIYAMAVDGRIDGVYTLAQIDELRDHLIVLARERGLLPS
ncbi:hypothetical protein LK459_07520 [Gordonia otitidis]|uniref:hypothetical protein n=1 Tax=Gordonia otitidis TaxID=249058 RepID=UPI001D1348F7|nr:hypothetical protein [Gordonia otitidis]UEA61500.1 hypothetical protein LK459_07520 [Gordonia otitidis]